MLSRGARTTPPWEWSAWTRVEHVGQDPGTLFVVAHAVEDDDDLVTADPRHHIVLAHTAADTAGDHTQQFVTGTVPELIVDLLEVVDVDECKDAFAAPAWQVFEGRREPSVALVAGHQAGQRVAGGALLQVLPLMDLLGDVAESGDPAQAASVLVDQGLGGRVHPHCGAIGSQDRELQVPFLITAGEPEHLRSDLPAMRLGDHVDRRVPQHLLRCPAQQLLTVRRDPDRPARQVVLDQHVRAVFGQSPEALRGGTHLDLAHLRLRDVDDLGDEPEHRAVRVAQGRSRKIPPHDRPVRTQVTLHQAARIPAAVHQLPQAHQVLVHIIGVRHLPPRGVQQFALRAAQ